jgi:hypothetical protein
MTYSVLRRYTPPTCTLEIMAQRSPLSRWTNQSLVKDLRFRLHLDDPKLAKDDWLTLMGDRTQLEALTEVVSAYVQRLLATRPDPAPIQSASLSTATATLDSVTRQNLPLTVVSSSAPLASTEASQATGISLQPIGNLRHQLCLGTLATEESGAVIPLSTLQLFDLANALDEYATDIVTLPALEQGSWIRKAPPWTQVAAVALVVVGLSTSIAKVLDGSKPSAQSTLPTNSQGASSTDQKLAIQLPPAATEKVSPAATSPQKLPPPPPPGSVLPTRPGLPTVMVPSTAPPSAPINQPPGADMTTTGVPANLPDPDPRPAMIVPDGRSQIVPPLPTASAPQASASGPSGSRGQVLDSTTATAKSRSAAAESTASNTTAFDTLPQVAEARRYFQQRWTPPTGLTQTLEYSLIINPDGTIQRIIPLGQASGDYVDRSGIPLVGEPLVSPITPERNIRLRLVLSPDGNVRTFLEGNN